MRTWQFPLLRPPGDGPWTDEPDKAQWIDPTTDLDCLAVRNRSGAWCGYVGLPPDHPLHGRDYLNLPDDINCHGGPTFSDYCAEIDGAEDGPYICHVPEPGRPAKVWWIGFDCGHAFDYRPTAEADMRKYAPELARELEQIESPAGWPRVTYKTFAYVQSEVTCLAVKLRRYTVAK